MYPLTIAFCNGYMNLITCMKIYLHEPCKCDQKRLCQLITKCRRIKIICIEIVIFTRNSQLNLTNKWSIGMWTHPSCIVCVFLSIVAVKSKSFCFTVENQASLWLAGVIIVGSYILLS